jgi:regulator of nucleoside diphosphate kinase
MLSPSPATLPRIMVSETEEHLLTLLATAAKLGQRSESVAHSLLSEMERADIVSDNAMPPHVVRMNSRVEFEIDGGSRQEAELVFPGKANIDEKRISVMTPIGTALIGLSVGQVITLRGHDGRPHELKVISVTEPAAERRSEVVD